ncbi:cbb3-type cytochrome c oxidase subunit I [Natrinema thermotolerans]|uniref:Cbb3-type cytochrome c oxidase subunit I n=1 Tax=Natrinema thermotolerans TaxID=121872 RepID=A0AAF0PDJ8_9EURY|nr:hypothetical protein [Natrinema thermotolerans]QCC60147.1 hypothetical protein DVR14_16545 [Natrinema thermotolerans]QCC61059.1 hypothetical protein DVR14_20665 [Natrinema thermotolerans]WMT07160.1 cbb3-type cytochrome c oxidase subunit I [Natrinema thermotolerans]
MNMQTRNDPFILMAGVYLTVGLLAAIGTLTVEAGLLEPLPRLRWVTVHFVTIGGLTQAVFGALPAFVAARSTRRRSSAGRSRWLQWVSVNAGYPLLLVGMTRGSTITAGAGAVLVLGALLSLLVTVFRLPSSTVAAGSARYFRTAPWFLVVGILAALGMLFGVHGPGGYFGSLEAHVHANVWGFLALVVAGVLLTVLPELLGTDRRFPRARAVTYWGLTIGAAGLVVGPWTARHELTIGGLVIYVVGTGALLASVVGTYRHSDRQQDSRIALVLGAYFWLLVPVPIAPFVLLFPTAVPAAAIERAAINGLVFGWLLQLAMAFLPVVAVAARRDPAAFVDAIAAAAETAPQPSWWQVGSANAGMLLLWLTAVPLADGVASLLTLGGYLLLAAAWAAFVVDLWTALAGERSVRRRLEETPFG